MFRDVVQDIYGYKVLKVNYPNWWRNSLSQCRDCRARLIQQDIFLPASCFDVYTEPQQGEVAVLKAQAKASADNVSAWHELSKRAFPGIAREMMAYLCPSCIKRVIADETEAYLAPYFWTDKYRYSLYDWNKWDVDSLGQEQYLRMFSLKLKYRELVQDTEAKIAKHGFDSETLKLMMLSRPLFGIHDRYEQLDENSCAVRDALVNLWHQQNPNDKDISGTVRAATEMALESHFFATTVAGFHTHKTMEVAVKEAFGSDALMKTSRTFGSIFCRVQHRGMTIEGSNGYISEEMQIVGLYSTLGPKMREALANALAYPSIDDLRSRMAEEPLRKIIDDGPPDEKKKKMQAVFAKR